MKRSTLFICLLAFLTLAFGLTAQANSGWHAKASGGPWSSTSTWDMGLVPIAGDNVFIDSNCTVTVDINNAACDTLVLGYIGGGFGILAFNPANQLTVSNTFAWGSGTAGDSGSIDMTSGGTLILQGTVTLNAAQAHLYAGAGTITFNGSSAQTLPALTYNHLNVSSTDTVTVAAGGAAVGGNFGIVAGTFSSAYPLSFKGSFQNDGTFSQTAGTSTFDGTSSQTLSGSGSTSFNQLAIDNTSGVILSQSISCTNLVLNGGNLDNTSFNVTTATGSTTTGIISRSNGTISTSPNFGTTPTVQYTNSATPLTSGPELPGAPMFNFTIDDTMGVTLNSNVTVSDTLRLTSGTLTTGSYKVTVTNTAPGAVIARANPRVGNLSGELDVAIAASSTGTYTFTDTSTVIVPDGTQSLMDVDMKVYPGQQPVPAPGTGTATNRYYVITPSDPLTATTLQLSYLVSELNGITESNLTLWRYDGTAWVNMGGIDNTTSHFVPLSGSSSWSRWTFADPSSPLPIEVASLTAKATANNVNVAWTTVSETNTLGFYVQRGTSKTGPFTTISSLIAGAGTSTAQHNYSYADNSVSSGTYYYRVHEVEKNGAGSYSSVITVTVAGVLGVREEGGVPAEFKLGQNYPNPFNPTTVINYDLPKAEYVHLTVCDMLGREVAALVNGVQRAGSKSIEFNAANLPSGLYFYRMTAGTFSETKKLLLLK